MSSPTIRIRLAQQPPLYFIAAVVVASLLPLLMQLTDGATAVALQRLPAIATTPVAFERTTLPAFAVLDDVPEPAVVAEATVEDEEVDDVVILDNRRRPRPRLRARPAPSSANVPSLAQRAKGACAKGNKTAARSAYRSVPVGDARRRAIRKACRDAGIWIL